MSEFSLSIPQSSTWRPLKPETFEKVQASINEIATAADASPLVLEQIPLDELPVTDNALGKAWTGIRNTNTLAEEKVEISTFTERGSRLYISEGYVKDVDRILGRIAFRKINPRKDEGHFNGEAIIGDGGIIIHAECFDLLGTGELSFELFQFSRQLGLELIWKQYIGRVKNERSKTTVKAGEKIGKSMLRALQGIKAIYG